MENRIYHLKEISDIKSGKRLPAGHDFVDGPTQHAYIRARDIKKGSILSNDFSYISDETHQKIKKYIIEKGDVVITIVANIGDIGYCDAICHGANLTENAVRLTNFNKEIVNSKYLAMLLGQVHMKQYMESLAAGAAQAKLGIYKIEKIKVSLPPLPTQQKIASILSTYDTLIENNTKRIRLLEQMAENLYKEWFVRFRFPGHENVKMGKGLPKGWTYGTLGDAVEFQNGFAFKSETFCEDGKYSVVTIKNVKDNGFDGNNTDKIAEIPNRMPSYCKLQEGDTLLSLTGNIGRVCRVQGDHYLLNQRVAKIKSKHPLYSYCLFKSEYIFASLNVISYGTAQLNLSPVKASMIKLAIPENELLDRFEKIAEPIFTEISSLHHQNQHLTRQRDLLLPRLMSGKLEVKI